MPGNDLRPSIQTNISLQILTFLKNYIKTSASVDFNYLQRIFVSLIFPGVYLKGSFFAIYTKKS